MLVILQVVLADIIIKDFIRCFRLLSNSLKIAKMQDTACVQWLFNTNLILNDCNDLFPITTGEFNNAIFWSFRRLFLEAYQAQIKRVSFMNEYKVRLYFLSSHTVHTVFKNSYLEIDYMWHGRCFYQKIGNHYI